MLPSFSAFTRASSRNGSSGMVLLVFCGCLALAWASCERWQGLPTWCAPVLSPGGAAANVWVDAGADQVSLAAAINSTGLLISFGQQNLTCIEGLLNFLCRVTFPSCSQTGTGAEYICASTCTAFSSQCPSTAQQFGAVNCTANFATNGCDRSWTSISDDEVCARPAVVYDDAVEACGIQCPVAMYSYDTYQIFVLTEGISSWIFFFLTLFTIFGHLIEPQYRRNVSLWFSVAILMLCASKLHEGATDWRDLVCNGKTDFDVSEKPDCIVMGILANVGFQCAVYQWSCIAVNVAIRIWFNPSRSAQKKLNIGYQIYSWGCTLIAAIVFLSNEKTALHSNGTACWLDGNLELTNIVQTAPMIWSCFVGLSAFAVGIAGVTRLGFKDGGIPARKLAKTNIKIVFFVLLFLTCNIVVIIVQIWQQKGTPPRRDMWAADFGAWVACLASGMSQECDLASRFPAWLFEVLEIVTVFQIACPFVFFGLKTAILRRWALLFRLVRAGRWRDVKHNFLDSSGSASTSTTTEKGAMDNTDALSKRTLDESY